MHPLPRKKRLLLTAEESEQWRNGTTMCRDQYGKQCSILNDAGRSGI